MNKQLIYSILQYKHSPILGEAINVGVLYYFPDEERKLYFYITDATRIKPIYKDFDARYFNSILKLIKNNVVKYSGDLYAEKLLNDNLKDFVHFYLLKDDDTSLQFSDLNSVINIYSKPELAVEEYTKILLPLSIKKESQTIKYNETYIIKKFKTRLFGHNEELADKVTKNYVVKTDELSFKFDFAWQNGSLNLVHPLSFDLQDTQSIQRKTAEYCSYLSWLNRYTKENNCRIDLLLAKPQESSLQNTYNKSIKLLQAVNSNKQVIPFEDIDSYTDKTAEYLLSI
ncbi:MAG: DUF3037 domain-containing protein [Paludibacter sp.]|nr:DUF3037 domain-containing protein [Paludibacter sp.]